MLQLINGIYACGNNHTLNTILKGYYDYKGFVVSGAFGRAETDLSEKVL